jgi:hypothetical protein
MWGGTIIKLNHIWTKAWINQAEHIYKSKLGRKKLQLTLSLLIGGIAVIT